MTAVPVSWVAEYGKLQRCGGYSPAVGKLLHDRWHAGESQNRQYGKGQLWRVAETEPEGVGRGGGEAWLLLKTFRDAP